MAQTPRPRSTGRVSPGLGVTEYDLITPEGIVQELARLTALATTYAKSHERVTALAEALSKELARRGSHERPCTILLTLDGLSMDGTPVAATCALTRRLKQDLETLGIGEIDFYRGLTAQDLIVFARRVRTLAQRPTGAHTAAESSDCLPGLSATIAARFSDFGVPTTSRHDEGVAACGIASAPLDVCDPQPDDESYEPDWGRLIDGIAREATALVASTSAGSEARPSTSGVPAPGSLPVLGISLPTAVSFSERQHSGGVVLPDGIQATSLRDLVRSVEEALRRVLDSRLRSPSHQSISSIVQEAKRVLEIAAPAAPISSILEHLRVALDSHLRDTFRAEPGVTTNAERSGRGERVPCEVPIAKLLADMEALPSEPAPLGSGSSDSTEGLTTLLWLLMTERRLVVNDGLLRRLTARLSQPLGPDDLEVLSQWTETLAQTPDGLRQLQTHLLRVFETMRLQTPSGPVAVLLGLTVDTRAMPEIWPYLALEILCGMPDTPVPLRERAIVALGKVPFPSLLGGKEALVTLHSRLNRRADGRFLCEPRAALYGLYEVLLDSSLAGAIGPHLVEGFRRKPPEGSAACALLAPGVGEQAPAFLRRVLQERRQGGESQNLQYLAAQALCADLDLLAPWQRREPWVVNAVRGLTWLRSPLARDRVRRIGTDKRLGFLPAWPRACRNVALSARARLSLEQQLDLSSSRTRP